MSPARSLIPILSLPLILAAADAEAKKKKSANAEGAAVTKVQKERKPKSQPFAKLNFGATLGGGYDSNVFNKPSGNTTNAGLGEVAATLKADSALSTKLSWSSALGIGGSYRSGEGDFGASAAKVSAKAKTGLQLLVFGNRKMPGGKKVSKKKLKYPAGRLGLDLKYGFSANPVIISPDEDITDSEEDLAEEDDFSEDEFSDDADDFEDDSEEDADAEEDEDAADEEDEADDEEAEEAAEAEEEEFIEDDVLEGKTFDLKGARHKFDGALKFTFEPVKGTNLGIKGGYTLGDNPEPEDENKPSPDYTQFGTGIKASQKIFGKYLRAKAGYTLGLRNFSEKTVRGSDELLQYTMHGIAAGLQSTPFKPLKFTLDYRYARRVVGAGDSLDSLRHSWSFGTQYKLTKKIAVLGKLSFADQGLVNADTKDARRFQGLVGLRVKI